MEYEGQGQQAANGLGYASVGGIAAQSQRMVATDQPTRTFEGIRDALSRVRSLSSVAEAILDRVSPQVRSISGEANAKTPCPSSYSYMLGQLHEELSALTTTLDALDTHI